MTDIKLDMKCTCTKIVFDKATKKIESIVTLDKTLPAASGSGGFNDLKLPLQLEIGKRYNFAVTDIESEKEPEGRLIREDE